MIAMGKARDAQLIGDPDAERASSGCQPRRRQRGLAHSREPFVSLFRHGIIPYLRRFQSGRGHAGVQARPQENSGAHIHGFDRDQNLHLRRDLNRVCSIIIRLSWARSAAVIPLPLNAHLAMPPFQLDDALRNRRRRHQFYDVLVFVTSSPLFRVVDEDLSAGSALLAPRGDEELAQRS